MKKNLAVLFLCLCSAAFSVDAQQKFTRLRFAGYEGKGGKPAVFFYAELDPSGLLKMHLNFRSGVKTYHYRVPDSTMQLAGELFDGSMPLVDHLSKKEMVKGTHFSNSSYRYLEYEYLGKKDGISFVRYLLDDRLRTFIIRIEEILDQEDLTENPGTIKPGDNFLRTLQQSHRNSKWLPTLD